MLLKKLFFCVLFEVFRAILQHLSGIPTLGIIIFFFHGNYECHLLKAYYDTSLL